MTPPVPSNGKWLTHTRFNAPGTYVLRCQAHDGGLSVTEDITFMIEP